MYKELINEVKAAHTGRRNSNKRSTLHCADGETLNFDLTEISFDTPLILDLDVGECGGWSVSDCK